MSYGDEFPLSILSVISLDQSRDGVVEVVLEDDLSRAVVPRVQLPVAPAGDELVDSVPVQVEGEYGGSTVLGFDPPPSGKNPEKSMLEL